MSASSSTTTSNIMLAISEKKTKSVDLYKHLRNFIVHKYSELDARKLEKDLQTLKQLRNKVESGGAADFPAARRDLLQKYYRALCVVEPRFPISYNKDDVNTMKFTWFDAFKNKHKASQKSIHLEKAAVLFNLGAVHSQIGWSHDRSAEEGRKKASHSFMAAAGAFAFLRENVAISVGGSATVDISVECVGLLERLMLAQAQECVYENTIAKGNSPGSCLNILRQVGQFYEEALAALTVAPLSQHFEKAWISHVQLKAAIFLGEACYMYSLELHTEEIARLKLGVKALAEARKTAPKGAADQQLLDAVIKLETNIKSKLERAMKQNDGVYMMGVPPSSSVPPLPILSMVKPMAMDDVLDASKEKMFVSFVPNRIKKSLSRYAELVDDIIRREEEKLQQGSELAQVRLKEMDLPDSILAREGIIPLPTALKEDIEAVLTCGSPDTLRKELFKLRDLNRANHALLEQNSQSSTLALNLDDSINEFTENLKQAKDSDARIEMSFGEHYALISSLVRYREEIAKPGSSSTRPPVYLYKHGNATVRALEENLRQLETLGAQRAGLVDTLNEMKGKSVNQDDLVPKLIATTGSHEDVFRQELSKYDRIREEIANNLESQEQLLMHIQAQNDEFAIIFDYKATCDKKYKEYEYAILKYRELHSAIHAAKRFYADLKESITQYGDMNANVQRQLSDLGFQDDTSSDDPVQTSPSGYSQQPPHPSHASPSSSNHPYPPPQHTMSPNYWQPPPHAGWQGLLYYNAPPGSMPHPPNPPHPPPHRQ